jgi:hypothetical protein
VCHLEKVFVSLLQPGILKNSFAALDSLSAQELSFGVGVVLPLPLALDHTVVLRAANQRLPATLHIAICYWLLVLQAQSSSNTSCKRDVVWYLTNDWQSCVMTAACL